MHRTTLIGAIFCCAIVASADPDLVRARQVKPRSAFRGHDFEAIATTLNRHLTNSGFATRPCSNHSLTELDELVRILLESHDARLDEVYQKVGDRRSLRHSNADAWRAESEHVDAADVAHSRILHDALRDGKCADIAMLWAHHVPTRSRGMLAQFGHAVPLLSTIDHRPTLAALEGSTASSVARLYDQQISCAVCHSMASDEVLPERHSTSSMPPVWSPRFHIDFVEYTHQLQTAKSEKGSFHLDYYNERMRWAHGKGQFNNWCECAGLPQDEARSACDIMSLKTAQDPAGAAYVIFRELNKCCRLAGWEKGFSPIRPDWLTRPANATVFLGQHEENGRTCYRWVNPNHGNPLMKGDEWSEDAEGVPCSYTDKFAWWAEKFEGHNLTFDPASFSKDLEGDEIFEIPAGMDCTKTCPNRHTWCFFTTGHILPPWEPPVTFV